MGYYDDYLEHHGIRGQKWGVRRFQKADGTLTTAGKKHYNSNNNDGSGETASSNSKSLNRSANKTQKNAKGDHEESTKDTDAANRKKKIIIAGAAVVGTALAAYGGYKLYQLNKNTTEAMSARDSQRARNLLKESSNLSRLASTQTNRADWTRSRTEADNLVTQARQLSSRSQAKNYSMREKADYLRSQRQKKRNN